MKKILILSYFFPPANFAASYRAASWAKFFHKFGYYPVIITRQWNKNQINAIDRLTNNETIVEKYDTYEVHYVQVKNTFRENIIYSVPSLRSITKPLVFIELLLKGSFWMFHPNAYLYNYLRKYLKSNHDVNWLVVTGNPFDLFKAGYDLSKEFGIKWIADYRDGWTLWGDYRGGIFNLIKSVDTPYEKKWVATAAFFTTVNEELVKAISELTGKKGYKIMNGFNPDDYIATDTSLPVNLDKDSLKLVYNGTLYKTQNLNTFFDGVRTYIKANPKEKIQIFFPGVLSDISEYERIKITAGEDILPYITFTHRLPKAQIITLQKACDIMLFFTHEGSLKGTFPSKMFEYFGIGKPILVCPNDNGSVTELINQTNTGCVANNADEVADFMQKVRFDKYSFVPSESEIRKYTREKQCELLAKLIDQHIDK